MKAAKGPKANNKAPMRKVDQASEAMATATIAVPPEVKQANHADKAPTFREDFGLTRKTLARMTGLSERTLASWEGGEKLSDSATRAVTAVTRLLQALAEAVHKDAIADWMETPNEAFDNLKPVEVMERGESDRIWRMVFYIGSGTVS